MRVWGNNGYPEIVPNTGWAATTIFSDGEPAYTAIYIFQDDALFRWRTTQNSPWFTAAQCEVINAPHRKKFWRKEARTFAVDSDALAAREAAFVLERREPLFVHRFVAELVPMENAIGGWLPSGANVAGMSQTAIDLAHRQKLRVSGDFQGADLVRKVVEGGCVEVNDLPTGTMWFYAD